MGRADAPFWRREKAAASLSLTILEMGATAVQAGSRSSMERNAFAERNDPVNVSTQTEQILNHLLAGKHLTALEALQRFGCLRLAARIGDLKKEGHEIKSTRVELPNGKSVASYTIASGAQAMR